MPRHSARPRDPVQWNGWLVRVDWQVEDGVPVPRGLHLEPAPDSDVRVDSLTLRGMPLAAILRDSREAERTHIEALREELLRQVPADAPTLQQYVADRADGLAKPFAGRKTAGRARLFDDDYQLTANVYRAAVQDLANPTEAVADFFQISKSAAAKRVAVAREREFLPKTTRGRVGPIKEQ